MRQIVRLAAAAAAAAMIIGFTASCDDDDDDLIGPNTRTYTATLFASNEVSPASTSPGAGIAFFVDNTTQIDWTLTLDDISGVTMSHIHGPALPNATASIIFDLFIPTTPPTGDLDNFTRSGTITNTTSATVSLDSLRTLFNNGRAYVNVHTTDFPVGAIRGQVVRTN